jgi:glycosyltransferase involved in cell wall biosynthesis
MRNDVSKKVTAIIKTFERPHCLDMLIKSIRKFYPTLSIIVADDSRQPQVRKDVEYHVLPTDSGVSEGRNFLVKQVKTPYVLLLDDDFCFINETRIEVLLDVLEKSDMDIVGGRYLEQRGVRNSQGTFKLKNGVLYYNKASYGRKYGVKFYDIVNNFFLARTTSLLQYTWYKPLKTGGQHLDFFLTHKGKLKVAMHPKIFIYHFRDRSNKEYKRYRSRGNKTFNPMFMNKHGISIIKREQSLFQPLNSVKRYVSSETKKQYSIGK